MRPRRFLLAALLGTATLLFAVGVIAERSVAPEPASPAASVEGSADDHAEEEAETVHSEEGGGTGEDARLLRVDVESTPFVVLAVLAGLALSAAAASELRHRSWFLMTVTLIVLAWAALDVREIFHQLNESNGEIAAVAAGVAALHLAAAAVARAAERGTLGEFKST